MDVWLTASCSWMISVWSTFSQTTHILHASCSRFYMYTDVFALFIPVFLVVRGKRSKRKEGGGGRQSKPMAIYVERRGSSHQIK